jgi:hypothetical protein
VGEKKGLGKEEEKGKRWPSRKKKAAAKSVEVLRTCNQEVTGGSGSRENSTGPDG